MPSPMIIIMLSQRKIRKIDIKRIFILISMSQIPSDLKYTKQHEWVRIKDNEATIGITDYAQNELTDIVFIEMPELNKEVKKGEILGVVESVKSVSEVFSPFNGKVKAINNDLADSPELINKEPYGNGWILVLSLEKKDEADELLSPEDYRQELGE
jgi:glycine cleavage system H protein